MKLTNGFDKKPFFVCLCHNVAREPNAAKEQFFNFFKEIGQNPSREFRRSIETLLDFFPNRTSFDLRKTSFGKDCMDIKKSFLKSVIGRKIFTFEITGASLENLVLEMLEIFNERQQKVDLLGVYIQVINNQKRRVLNEAIDFYLKRVAVTIVLQEMPYNPEEIFELHQKVVSEAMERLSDLASNCMNLAEYMSVFLEMTKKVEETLLELEITNGKASQEYNLELKEEL